MLELKSILPDIKSDVTEVKNDLLELKNDLPELKHDLPESIILVNFFKKQVLNPQKGVSGLRSLKT